MDVALEVFKLWKDLLMKCPACDHKAVKVIYAGFPMKLCEDQNCSTLWGFWSFIPGLYFNGMFIEYEGSYLGGLWYFLFGDLDE